MRSFSIDQWCELHSFSRPFFYKLQMLGKGPKIFKVGKSTRVSEQANNEWIAALETAAFSESMNEMVSA